MQLCSLLRCGMVGDRNRQLQTLQKEKSKADIPTDWLLEEKKKKEQEKKEEDTHLLLLSARLDKV